VKKRWGIKSHTQECRNLKKKKYVDASHENPKKHENVVQYAGPWKSQMIPPRLGRRYQESRIVGPDVVKRNLKVLQCKKGHNTVGTNCTISLRLGERPEEGEGAKREALS